MSSPISHSAVWLALWPAVQRRVAHLSPLRRVIIGLAVLAALLVPDADALPAFLLGERITHFHNHGSHSLLAGAVFAIPFSLACGLLTGRNWMFFWGIGFAAYSSHVIIDAFTFGRGVQMFWPLTDTRYGGRFYIFYGVRHSVNAPLWCHVLTVLNDLAFAAVIWTATRWTQLRTRERFRITPGEGPIDIREPTMKAAPPAD